MPYGDGAHHHGGLHGLRQRRHGVVADDAADVFDHGHGCSSPVAGSPYASSCSGAVDPNYTISYVRIGDGHHGPPDHHRRRASSMAYGVHAAPSRRSTAASSTATPPRRSRRSRPARPRATDTSSVPGSPYPTSCSGAADPNYTITYVPGATTVTPLPIPVAVSGSQANGGAPSFAGNLRQPAYRCDRRHVRRSPAARSPRRRPSAAAWRPAATRWPRRRAAGVASGRARTAATTRSPTPARPATSP